MFMTISGAWGGGLQHLPVTKSFLLFVTELKCKYSIVYITEIKVYVLCIYLVFNRGGLYSILYTMLFV